MTRGYSLHKWLCLNELSSLSESLFSYTEEYILQNTRFVKVLYVLRLMLMLRYDNKLAVFLKLYSCK